MRGDVPLVDSRHHVPIILRVFSRVLKTIFELFPSIVVELASSAMTFSKIRAPLLLYIPRTSSVTSLIWYAVLPVSPYNRAR